MSIITFAKQLFNSLKDGHWSALANLRYYKQWKTSLLPGHGSVEDELPWINFPSTHYLDKYLKKEMTVFEFGGGGSTLYFLAKGNNVTTVEHNPEWFHKIEPIIKKKYNTRWQGNLILPEKQNLAELGDISNPGDYLSGDEAFANESFQAYASFIDNFPHDSFDVVLVDGRARPSCLLHSLSKVKKDGLLILDNSERKYYMKNSELRYAINQDFLPVQNQHAPLPFTRHFTTTTIWKKK